MSGAGGRHHCPSSPRRQPEDCTPAPIACAPLLELTERMPPKRLSSEMFPKLSVSASWAMGVPAGLPFHLPSGPDTSQPSPLPPEQGSKCHQHVGACPVPQLPRLPALARCALGERTHPGPPWGWIVSRVGRISAGWGSISQLAAGKGLCEGSVPRAESGSLPIQPCSQFLKPGFAPLQASDYP